MKEKRKRNEKKWNEKEKKKKKEKKEEKKKKENKELTAAGGTKVVRAIGSNAKSRRRVVCVYRPWRVVDIVAKGIAWQVQRPSRILKRKDVELGGNGSREQVGVQNSTRKDRSSNSVESNKQMLAYNWTNWVSNPISVGMVPLMRLENKFLPTKLLMLLTERFFWLAGKGLTNMLRARTRQFQWE